MSFGENLKKFREAKGITQKELSERIGKSVRSISYYETSGKDSVPEVNTLGRIAAELNISVSQLLGVEEEVTQEEKLLNLLEVKTLNNGIVWYYLNEENDNLTSEAAYWIDLDAYIYQADPVIIKGFFDTYKITLDKIKVFYALLKNTNYFLCHEESTNKIILIMHTSNNFLTVPIQGDKEQAIARSLFSTVKDLKTRNYHKMIYDAINDLEEK